MKKSNFFSFLENKINKFPDPVYIFIILTAILAILSYIFSAMDIQINHPIDKSIVGVKNIISVEGVRYLFSEAVNNFINFPPLGIVLAMIIGIGVAEKSGLFESFLKFIVQFIPNKALNYVIIFLAINSSLMGDAAIVVLTPLAGMLYLKFGRSPVIGIVAVFAGICGGFSANLLITSFDPLLASFTDSAAKNIDTSYVVNPTGNYYFMIISVFLLTFVGGFITSKLERYFKYDSVQTQEEVAETNKKAIINVSIFSLVYFALLTVLIIIKSPIFYYEESYEPLFKSIVFLLTLYFLLTGVIYGFASGNFTNTKDIVKSASESLSTMGIYILLAFVAGQFIALFKWSNLGIIIAVNGADVLSNSGLNGLSISIGLFIFCAFINLFISSASAKWAILSPIFVPMMLIMGYTPEYTQLIYRLGDSTTNIVTPLLPYFPLLILYAQKYNPKIGLGNLLMMLIPYSIGFGLIWIIQLIFWYLLDLQIGIGVGIFLD